MGIIDKIFGGAARASLVTEIEELNAIALLEPERQEIPAHRAMLWEAFCNGTANLVHQLFVESTNKQLDWGLMRHRKKLNRPRLFAVYWWMLLYHLVLFRNRGLGDYSKDEEFAELEKAAESFMNYMVSSSEYQAINPGPWEDGWKSQVCLEASLGLYNKLSELLGLHVDFEARIARVSNFTSATENAYDTNIVKPILERNGSQQMTENES